MRRQGYRWDNQPTLSTLLQIGANFTKFALQCRNSVSFLYPQALEAREDSCDPLCCANDRHGLREVGRVGEIPAETIRTVLFRQPEFSVLHGRLHAERFHEPAYDVVALQGVLEQMG